MYDTVMLYILIWIHNVTEIINYSDLNITLPNQPELKQTQLEAQGPCTGHRSIIAILHGFSSHEKYTN